ncbi:MAG: cupin [Parcubacteria group bacterium]|jgi:quercetin dioxygenase-like cupin family protein|nr:cupin [Parcubacteria group bacterium]|tara:strand:- start:534 stop:854 length:321 start_codon:yes stop_codon:yes gene_type:complete
MAFFELEQIERKALFPNSEVRFIHTENMTIAYWDVLEGAVIPDHKHPHEQFTNVLEGEMEVTIDGETQVIGPGQVAFYPANAPHSAIAKVKSRVMDVFSPARDDYK